MVWCSLHGVPTPGSKQQLSRQDVEDAVDDWPPPRQPQSVPGRRQRRVICASCNQTLHMHHPCSTLPQHYVCGSMAMLFPSLALHLALLALNCDHVIPYHDFLAKRLYQGHKPPMMTDFVLKHDKYRTYSLLTETLAMISTALIPYLTETLAMISTALIPY